LEENGVFCLYKIALQSEIERLKEKISGLKKQHAISEQSWKNVKEKMWGDYNRDTRNFNHQIDDFKHQVKDLRESLDRAKSDLVAMRARLPSVCLFFLFVL
jgi:phage shock protein A